MTAELLTGTEPAFVGYVVSVAKLAAIETTTRAVAGAWVGLAPW